MSTRGYYDTYWTEQGFNPTGGLSRDLAGVYGACIRPRDVALDVGCGDGRTSGPWLLEHAATYTGVDISEPAVATARALGLNALLIEDACELPFPPESFDVAVAIEVFEHLFAPHDACVEIRRVLRPGGRLVVTVPNVAHWKQRADLALRGRWDPKGDDLGIEQPWRDPHIRFFTAGALGRMLETAGFNPVTVAGRRGSIAANVRILERFARPHEGRIGRALLRRLPGIAGAGLVAVAVK
jgi:SAM-dependent methyltransferase